MDGPPERGGATRRLHELVNSGAVTTEGIGRDSDSYGRKLRIVLVDGTSASATRWSRKGWRAGTGAGGGAGAAEPPSARERLRSKRELASRDGVSPAGGWPKANPFDVTDLLRDG